MPPRRTCSRQSPRRKAQLPPACQRPPSYQKVNPADQAILYLGLSSPTLPLSQVDEYAETYLAERISMISGVAQVQVYGSQKYAVRIQVDPMALATRGIGIDEVADAIANANVDLPTGTLYGANQAFTVQANGQLTNAAAYRPMIVAYRNGAPVRLDDIGRVIDSVRTTRSAGLGARQSRGGAGDPAPARDQHGRGRRCDQASCCRPSAQSCRPRSASTMLYDRSQTIRASVDDVQFTLLLTIALVVMVIFLFLRNVSATIIPSLALADVHHRHFRA